MVQGSLLRVKLHPIFMEKDRLFRRPEREGTFNIFHQIFAGLTSSELAEYHLSDYSAQNLTWMPRNHGREEKTNLHHKTGFCSWKKSLSQLGIPLPDILRVVAGVILVGNMQYDRPGDHCVTKVAALLGVTQASLVGGLWRRTQAVRGDLVTREVGEREWEIARRGLASSLYLRTVNMIIKRINSHHMTSLTDCEKQAASSSFIGILDMFGWQSSLHGYTCSMEQLVMNTCSEYMQELYNTSVGIDTVPTMKYDVLLSVDRVTHNKGDSQELLSSLATTGIKIAQDCSFTIHHYMGDVTYDSSYFIGKFVLYTYH